MIPVGDQIAFDQIAFDEVSADFIRQREAHTAIRLTDDHSKIHDERAERAMEARRHRDAARRSTALAIGTGDIGTYRILMAFAAEHDARAAELETGVRRRG